jgi:two-component system OmpR family response regulator
MFALYNRGCKIPVKKMEKNKLRLLVVEDEKKLCDMIAKSLHQAGYEVDTCNDGEEALDMIYAEMYDLIVLDLNLPGMDGMDILRELRKENEETKVLILSARSQIADKVDGLDAGADDYIVKPFAMEELLARLRIWSRRTVSLEDPGELCFGDLSYRPSVRQLSGPAGKEVLPKRLAQLIELLLRNAEVPITRNVIFNRIWGPDAEVTDAVIDTYIHLTRQRLAHLQSAVKIQNSRGTGYQLSYEREL